MPLQNQPPDLDLTYEGKYNPYLGERRTNGQLLYPYLPAANLIESVRLAIILRRPLLLMGEPGCGKTKLASAIAYELTKRNAKALKIARLNEWPFFSWYVKSISKAKEGLYTYDAVARLRDVQLANSEFIPNKIEVIERLQNISHGPYIKLGPLGKALNSKLPALLLIDEIDKASVDFPNDLLLELDEGRFFIEETKTWIPSENILPDDSPSKPIIIITSNNERPLPDAFLRRCFFCFIEPPNQQQLEAILHARFGSDLPDIYTDVIIDTFLEVREIGKEYRGGKTVSTSELIDWVRALLLADPDKIPDLLEKGLPYSATLHKTRDEQIRYLKSLKTDDE